jgi:hypothetical protein
MKRELKDYFYLCSKFIKRHFLLITALKVSVKVILIALYYF